MNRLGSTARAAGAALALVLGLLQPHLAAAAADSCIVVHEGLDPSIWTTGRAPFLGKAVGQTFRALDTVLTKVTVWRPPDNRSVIGAHLFIVAVDTSRIPPWPDTRIILLDGPTVHVYDSDPPGQLIEMPFVIDPPLALPRPGLYAWFLQGEDCDQSESWRIAASTADPYPYGIYWLTARRVNYPCVLAPVEGGEDTADLLFDIEFCRPSSTPVRGSSWGSVKIHYR